MKTEKAETKAPRLARATSPGPWVPVVLLGGKE